MNSQQLSVVVITLNEEKNIARCLNSIAQIADEIIVVDSNSTDNTVAIAKAAGATVIIQPFLGYIEQKNFALQQASYKYCLSLDADECLDNTALQAITTIKEQGFAADGYKINRCNFFNGKWIRRGTWYPDTKLRLVNKEKAKWGGVNPHDQLQLQSNKIVHIVGDILHYSYANIQDMIAQNNKFTSIMANALYQQGKRSNWCKMVLNPLVAFVNGYFFKAGFLDGMDGFIIAKTIAYFTFVKYAKLYNLQKQQLA
jgi:glycosyltransferase involved in cell wall biosynthesis